MFENPCIKNNIVFLFDNNFVLSRTHTLVAPSRGPCTESGRRDGTPPEVATIDTAVNLLLAFATFTTRLRRVVWKGEGKGRIAVKINDNFIGNPLPLEFARDTVLPLENDSIVAVVVCVCVWIRTNQKKIRWKRKRENRKLFILYKRNGAQENAENV